MKIESILLLKNIEVFQNGSKLPSRMAFVTPNPHYVLISYQNYELPKSQLNCFVCGFSSSYELCHFGVLCC